MKQQAAVNDFVIRFANVNGSGSASANNLFAKAVFRMGVPVSPKNIFPSNIQGLPTWYEVRVNEAGHVGRRGGYDLVVAVNGQTLRQDYDGLEPGGYFLYDSSRPLPEDFQRDDLTLIPLPLTHLVNEAVANVRMRPLLKNILYVGALAALFDMELAVLADSLRRQFEKNPRLAEPNIHALEIGHAYARGHFPDTCRLKVRQSDRVGDAVIMDGNTAAALGALYGGATVVGWYPITPSTSIIEAFGHYAGKYRVEADTGRMRVAIVQAEDELAAIGIVIGASWNGARAFTATSGAGVSLMTELLGLAYFAEVPTVLVNVQRVGPSTGMPTRTQQSDLLACAWASHGDTKHPLLLPCDPRECFDMTARAFDLAERLQTPVIVMSDLDLGMNDHFGPPLAWDPARRHDRGKVLDADQLEQLTATWAHVELPPRLVENEARNMLAQQVEQIRRSGQNPGQVPADAHQQFLEPARRRVLAGLLVGEVARRHDLRLDPKRLNETLRLIASTYEEPEQVVEMYRNDPQLMQGLQNRVMEEQVIDWIAERAQHTEAPLSFQDAIRG